MAKEGLIFVITFLCVSGFGAALARSLGMTVAGYSITAVGLVIALFCGYFFRDPERPLPADPGLVYSPGDGTVLTVGSEPDYPGTTIRVFLSIFNVHIQRFPCSGVVREIQLQKGGFVAAMKPDASKNMRNIVRIGTDSGDVVVEQITGLVARRIRCWTRVGERAEAGKRYGLIQFGSQVAVRVPAGVTPVVKPGDKVVGGVTPIAQWTKAN